MQLCHFPYVTFPTSLGQPFTASFLSSVALLETHSGCLTKNKQHSCLLGYGVPVTTHFTPMSLGLVDNDQQFAALKMAGRGNVGQSTLQAVWEAELVSCSC